MSRSSFLRAIDECSEILSDEKMIGGGGAGSGRPKKKKAAPKGGAKPRARAPAVPQYGGVQFPIYGGAMQPYGGGLVPMGPQAFGGAMIAGKAKKFATVNAVRLSEQERANRSAAANENPWVMFLKEVVVNTRATGVDFNYADAMSYAQGGRLREQYEQWKLAKGL